MNLPRLAKIAVTTICVTCVGLLFLPYLVVTVDRKSVSAGEEVIVPNVSGAGGAWTAEKVEGDKVLLKGADGRKEWFPLANVKER